MALQEKLDKFKKQQQKCQSTLIRIGASTEPKHTQKAVSAAALVNATPSTPTVKFSSDVARFQRIYSVRKSPVGAQIKHVIDLLLEKRQALTAEQINKACYVDVNANKAVFDSLRNNLKVNYNGKRFSYKSKHDLKNKSELLNLIRKFPDGIDVIDLKDACPNVMKDLQALKASSQIWLLSNFNSKEDIAYPNDPKVSIQVDDELKQLFRGTKLPRDMIDMEKYLQKNGDKPVTNTAKRRAMAQVHNIPFKPKIKRKKQREITKRTKLTNTHLPELFQILNGS
ncbi:hypothetical protein FNV43_RR24734 [Rhamnella rubrinervis]|uniref:Transcription initiation factor IIE subunit beta n=1 Tax=Rhamnella rubrinervis TaxID=2594499 RepID=A0A8K0GQI0_9ROSA|nr:hypothetical protein FNV43_RR24734 [Rhamnella rubrinervis]